MDTTQWLYDVMLQFKFILTNTDPNIIKYSLLSADVYGK